MISIYNTDKEKCLNNIDYHIIDKCNLNCVACGHFAPLAGNRIVTAEQANIELKLLSTVTNNGKSLQRLTITGGEVLLNNDIYKILEISRKNFSYTEIVLYTNGILIDKLYELVDVMKCNNIKLFISKYQLTEKIKNKLENLPYPFIYITRIEDDEYVGNFYKYMVSDKPVANSENILKCEGRFNCLQYYEGKLYLCQYLPYFKYFNEKFDNNIPYKGNEYLQLKYTTTIDDILEYQRTKLYDFCYHCVDAGGCHDVIPWSVSKIHKNEWLLE